MIWNQKLSAVNWKFLENKYAIREWIDLSSAVFSAQNNWIFNSTGKCFGKRTSELYSRYSDRVKRMNNIALG